MKKTIKQERKEYLAFIDKWDPTGEMTRALKARIASAKLEKQSER